MGVYYGQRYEAVLAAVDYDDIQNIPDFQHEIVTGPGTSFTLTTGAPKNVAALDVSIDGVTQRPGVDYTVTNLAGGTQIAFTSTLEAGEQAVIVYRAIPGASQTLAYTEQFTAVSDDATPVLGGDLNVNTYGIKSAPSANLKLTPGTGGKVQISDISYPSSDGTSGQFLMTDGNGTLTWQTPPGAVGGEANTASNAGTNTDGVGLFKAKSNVNLEFKRLIAGDGIVITSEENLIRIKTPDYTLNKEDRGLLPTDNGDLQPSTSSSDYGFISADTAVNIDPVISTGLDAPTVITNTGHDSRLFIAEQGGKIKVYKGATVLSTPFLDISSKLQTVSSTYDERGLLGLAFHPNFNSNGWFFVYYSAPKSGTGIDHESILAKYTVADPANDDVSGTTEDIIMRFDQPYSNHNGGGLAFGSDGFLYIGVGDGGSQGDPDHVAQDNTKLLGKILRINIDLGSSEYGLYSIPTDNPYKDHSTYKEEIFARGFRNPYRISIDQTTGKCWAGDVGQNNIESVKIVGNGENHGWSVKEGSNVYDINHGISVATAEGTDVHTFMNAMITPAAEYDHTVGSSIIGGLVYRGSTCTELIGKYVFADWSKSFTNPAGVIYYLKEPVTGVYSITELNPIAINISEFIVGFGEDVNKELYMLTRSGYGPNDTGKVYKFLGQTVV